MPIKVKYAPSGQTVGRAAYEVGVGESGWRLASQEAQKYRLGQQDAQFRAQLAQRDEQQQRALSEARAQQQRSQLFTWSRDQATREFTDQQNEAEQDFRKDTAKNLFESQVELDANRAGQRQEFEAARATQRKQEAIARQESLKKFAATNSRLVSEAINDAVNIWKRKDKDLDASQFVAAQGAFMAKWVGRGISLQDTETIWKNRNVLPQDPKAPPAFEVPDAQGQPTGIIAIIGPDGKPMLKTLPVFQAKADAAKAKITADAVVEKAKVDRLQAREDLRFKTAWDMSQDKDVSPKVSFPDALKQVDEALAAYDQGLQEVQELDRVWEGVPQNVQNAIKQMARNTATTIKRNPESRARLMAFFHEFLREHAQKYPSLQQFPGF